MTLTSGGVVLRESGDTSLTCCGALVEGGYEEGRATGMGVWLQLDVLQVTSVQNQHFSSSEGFAVCFEVDSFIVKVSGYICMYSEENRSTSPQSNQEKV